MTASPRNRSRGGRSPAGRDPAKTCTPGGLPGTLSLPWVRPKDPVKERLKEATLVEIVDKTEDVVFYGGTFDTPSKSAPFACAKALTWGFTRVYYFAGGPHAWNKAGYPVERGL